MKNFLFLNLLILIPLFSFGQQSAKNIYAELGGPGIAVSVSYDTRLSKTNNGIGVRAGLGLIFDPYSTGFTVPLEANYLLGNNKHFLELGAGASFVHFKEKNQDTWFNFKKENFLAPYGSFGYRYQPVDKGFTFRAGVCTFFNSKVGLEGVGSLYPALSFGYSFL